MNVYMGMVIMTRAPPATNHKTKLAWVYNWSVNCSITNNGTDGISFVVFHHIIIRGLGLYPGIRLRTTVDLWGMCSTKFYQCCASISWYRNWTTNFLKSRTNRISQSYLTFLISIEHWRQYIEHALTSIQHCFMQQVVVILLRCLIWKINHIT